MSVSPSSIALRTLSVTLAALLMTMFEGSALAAEEVKLRLRVQELTEPNALTVKINGMDLGVGTKSGVWFDYKVDPSFVKKGTNRFEVMFLPGSAVAPVLQDLVLSVQHTKRPSGPLPLR